MPPLRSPELHRVAREELGPVLLGLGFKRLGSASASWARPDGDRWLVLWLQPSRSAGGAPDRFEFTIELRRSSRPETGGDGPRSRLATLLTPSEVGALVRARHAVGHGPDDTWFCQSSAADAHAVLATLAGLLPAAIDRFLA
jgi:hypothetical protein